MLTCPADASVQCSAHAGVPASDAQLSPFFAGASAVDACDANPALTHNAPPFFSLGSTQVTFSARDQSLNSSSCIARVSVVDTLPPPVACPAPAVVECMGPQGIATADQQLAAFFAAAGATDVCDASPTLSNDAPASLPMGTTPITFTARDASGNARSCASAVRVADTAAPQLTVSLSAGTLWPPNHTMIPITATVTVSGRGRPVSPTTVSKMCERHRRWHFASSGRTQPVSRLDARWAAAGVPVGSRGRRRDLLAARRRQRRGRGPGSWL